MRLIRLRFWSKINLMKFPSTQDNLLHIKGIDGQEVEQLLSLLRSLHPYLVQRKSNVSKVVRDVTGNQPSVPGNQPSVPGNQSSVPASQAIVNSLLPQYMAVFRLSYPSHIHSLSSVVSSVSSAASSASKGIKGSTSSESHTYLLILRNPLSSEKTFFPIHHTYHLTADGIKHVYGSKTWSTGNGSKYRKQWLHTHPQERGCWQTVVEPRLRPQVPRCSLARQLHSSHRCSFHWSVGTTTSWGNGRWRGSLPGRGWRRRGSRIHGSEHHTTTEGTQIWWTSFSWTREQIGRKWEEGVCIKVRRKWRWWEEGFCVEETVQCKEGVSVAWWLIQFVIRSRYLLLS